MPLVAGRSAGRPWLRRAPPTSALALVVVLLAFPDMFLRGRAKPGQSQFYACSHWPDCVSAPVPASSRKDLGLLRCRSHNEPMKEPYHKK